MHEVETMFSARQVPWHGLGVVTPDALTAEDAIIAAGLDWEVLKEQAERRGVKVPGKYWTYRSTDDLVLGMVGPDWEPLQNREAFTFADNLVDEGLKFETAGSLRRGRVVFLTAKLPMTIRIDGDDLHEAYLLLRMGHDGKMSVAAEIVMIRVVCMNTLTAAMRGAKSRWSITHTNKKGLQVQQAREALGISFEYAEAFEDEANKMIGISFTDEELQRFLEDTLTQRPKTPEVIQAVIDLSKNSNTIPEKFRGTAWGALNAVTEFMDHGRDTRSAEAKFFTTVDGQARNLRNAFVAQFV